MEGFVGRSDMVYSALANHTDPGSVDISRIRRFITRSEVSRMSITHSFDNMDSIHRMISYSRREKRDESPPIVPQPQRTITAGLGPRSTGTHANPRSHSPTTVTHANPRSHSRLIGTHVHSARITGTRPHSARIAANRRTIDRGPFAYRRGQCRPLLDRFNPAANNTNPSSGPFGHRRGPGLTDSGQLTSAVDQGPRLSFWATA